MSKVAVVYWSGTGNTETMANLVADGAKEAGVEVDVMTPSGFDSSKLGDYDAFAFGCPAMGDEELEEDEFEPMYSAVEGELASGGKPTVLFGSYDWNEGEWMDVWKDRAVKAGVNVVDTLIVKDYPEGDAAEDCKKLGSSMA